MIAGRTDTENVGEAKRNHREKSAPKASPKKLGEAFASRLTVATVEKPIHPIYRLPNKASMSVSFSVT